MKLGTPRFALALSLPMLLLLLSCGTNTEAQLNEVKALLDGWRGDGSILEQAHTDLDSILAQSPDSAPAYRAYARYYIMSGYRKYKEVDPEALAAAEASLLRALELDPNYSDAYVLAGHLYFFKGENQRAKNALDKAEALGSKDPWLHLNRADIIIDEGNFDGAATLYRRVIDSKSTNSKVMESAYSGLIGYYRRTNRDADADRGYRELIAYAPHVAWSYGNYATFLLCRMDQPVTAITQFKIALGKMRYKMATSGLAAAHYRLWALATIKGEPEQANAQLEAAQSLQQGDPVEIYQTYCRNTGGSAVDEMKAAVELAESKRGAE